MEGQGGRSSRVYSAVQIPILGSVPYLAIAKWHVLYQAALNCSTTRVENQGTENGNLTVSFPILSCQILVQKGYSGIFMKENEDDAKIAKILVIRTLGLVIKDPPLQTCPVIFPHCR